MVISDRNLGILSVVGLLLIIIVVASIMVKKSSKTSNRLWVEFEELGILQPEDPVTSRGHSIGKIGEVQWKNHKALVEVVFDQPMILHEGTILRNENYSIMGQRRLEVTVDKKSPIVDASHIYQGEFEPGIAEVLHLIDALKEQILMVKDVVILLQEGDSTQESLIDVFNKTVNTAEDFIGDMEKIVVRTQPQVRKILAKTHDLGDKALTLSEQADTSLQNIYQQGKHGIEEANKLILNIEESLVSLIEFIEHFENQPFYEELMEKQEVLVQINVLVKNANDFLSMFTEKGGFKIIDDKGKPRGLMKLRNINLFGKTARQKARIRQKKAVRALTKQK